jgi:hypothetical protein
LAPSTIYSSIVGSSVGDDDDISKRKKKLAVLTAKKVIP